VVVVVVHVMHKAVLQVAQAVADIVTAMAQVAVALQVKVIQVAQERQAVLDLQVVAVEQVLQEVNLMVVQERKLGLI
jgi:hypothetical protein